MVVSEFFFLKEFLIITLAAFFYSNHQSYTLKFILYLAIDASLLYEIPIFQDYPLQYKKGLLLNFAEIMQEGKVANKIKIKSEN